MVLRVSKTLVFVPFTARTNSLVRVAMPVMRCMRFRITRSVERRARGVVADDGEGLAFFYFDSVEDFGVADDLEAAYGRGGHAAEDL